MQKQWHIRQPSPQAVRSLQEYLKCSQTLATLLVNRKIKTPAEATEFLNPGLANLHNPLTLSGINSASNRIYEALRRQQKILIFGDYDTDGITATALLLMFLMSLDANVSYYIPDRIKEGYGLHTDHIKNMARPQNIDLIITVDCGSWSHDAIQMAQKLGIDVIVTDHHEVPATPPPAVAFINPKRSGQSADFFNIAGVGVAFNLIIGLRKYLRDKRFWQKRPQPNLKQFCDIVALGTVADAVPLKSDNRVLTRTGIELMQTTPLRPGLNALFELSRTDPRFINSDDIAYRLAPRLNAAGRMDHARIAVELLLAENSADAQKLAHHIDALNSQRRDLEKQILTDIQEHFTLDTENRSIVLAHEAWHLGVLGIIAARLVEMYHRPVILMAIKDGIGRGSARSIPPFNMFEGLSQCANYLEGYGGHAAAAGLTIRSDNIASFIQAFEETARQHIPSRDWEPVLTNDMKLDLNDVSETLLDDIQRLQPFGQHNPEPQFQTHAIRVVDSRPVGSHHRRMTVCQDANPRQRMPAIYFNANSDAMTANYFKRMAYRLQWNHWNGRRQMQLRVIET